MGAEVKGSPMSNEKHEVAVFDENRVLIDVKEVDKADHVTDPKRRQMKLPPNHDVRGMIGRYRVSPDYGTLEIIPEKIPADPFSWYHSGALVAWARIEDELFRVFCGLLQDEVRGAAVYYTLRHFNLKLTVTHAVATAVLQADAANAWKAIYDGAKKAAGQRNVLAHFGDMWISGEGVAPYRILVPSMYTTGKLSSDWQQQAGYARAELEEKLGSFLKLHREINSFADECGFAHPNPSRLIDIINVIRKRGGGLDQ